MKWKVGPVNRVVKQAPDDWDFDTLGAEVPEDQLRISYNVGVEGIVSESQIRAEVRTFLMKLMNMIMMKWIFSSLQLQGFGCFTEDSPFKPEIAIPDNHFMDIETATACQKICQERSELLTNKIENILRHVTPPFCAPW